jgi:hypothetical protein
MSVLSDWLEMNKMNVEFQKGELCRIFGLKMVAANGIIAFTGGDNSPVANYVVGKTFNFNLEEVLVEVPKVTAIDKVVNVVVTPTPPVKVEEVSTDK